MDNDSFFENLANGKAEADENYEIELAKSNAGTMATRPKVARSRAEAKENERWADGEPEGQLTVDVYQTPSEIVVESAIAGVKPDDIDINVTADSVSIKGSRNREKEVSDEDYLYQECYWGRFARSIILPQEVDPENADVVFKNGILTIRLPKVNKKKTTRLKVRID
jgi:HSP20 family protein